MKKPILIFASIAGSSFAATVDDLTLSVSDGKVTITDCDTAASGELIVPEFIDGNQVVAVAGGLIDGAFINCSGLTSIVLPDSVTSLGNRAFRNCTGITSFSFPPNVSRLENQVLEGCSGLETVNISDATDFISTSAFTGCTSLSSINASASALNYSTKNGVLYNKDETTLIKYPIGKADTSFTVPDGVTGVGVAAFTKAKVIEVTLPEGLLTISATAFLDANQLTTVKIPSTVSSVGPSAFHEASSLTQVIFEGSAPTTINSFQNLPSGAQAIVLPEFVDTFGGEGALFDQLIVTLADVTPVGDGITITSITTTAGSSTITFTADANTTYLVTSSTTLQGFAAVATTPLTVVTDASGNATFEVDASAPKNFFVVEAQP